MPDYGNGSNHLLAASRPLEGGRDRAIRSKPAARFEQPSPTLAVALRAFRCYPWLSAVLARNEQVVATRWTFPTSRCWMFILLVLFSASVFAQYKYGVQPMTMAGYQEVIKKSPNKQLVNLEKEIPALFFDIRYATKNNFTGEQIYQLPRAYARKPVAEALKKIQAELKPKGLSLKIYDAYRPYKATVKFYEVYRDTTYVASPYRGSRHNRGCALDLTLADAKTGNEIKMPTEFDSFKKEAWPSTPVADPEARANRKLLIDIMQKHGFKVNSSEWWHFDFVGWQQYEVLDIDFEELETRQ
jgi:D-alanyl-D-alanine dipeptidase